MSRVSRHNFLSMCVRVNTRARTHTLTVILHLLQQFHSTLLLPGVVVEHALDVVPGDKHLFGEDVQQLVVDHQVSLHAKLLHLQQGGVDELHVAAASLLPLGVHVDGFAEGGLGFGIVAATFKQVLVSHN